MRYHSQNLTADYLDRKERAIFWAGRAWLYLSRKNPYDAPVHWEWSLGKYARSFAAWIAFGYGESDRGICIHLCLPFLLSIYVVFERAFHCKECQLGCAIHGSGFWLYTFSYSNEWNRDYPWWRKGFHWEFPWSLRHWSTDILDHNTQKPVWGYTRKSPQKPGTIGGNITEQLEWEKKTSRDYPYRYVLKNGTVQERTASVHISLMEWRARWWPLIPIQKTSKSIGVNFSEEVGEGSGSWKGGCTGCGYEMLPGETAEQTLRRMERDRKFTR